MRNRIRLSNSVPLLALLACVLAFDSARALPGNVLSSQKLSDTQGNFTPVIDNLDEFGESVAGLGDLDGAGPAVTAMAIGVAFDDDGGLDRGAVYITFLAANGTVLSSTKISDTVNFPGFPLDDGDWFGNSVAFLGDLDGAGPSVAAIAVGAPGDDDGALNNGAVYILFLSANGTVLSVQKISNTANLPGAPLLALDEFGSSLASLGDLDGAGSSTRAIAVGAIGDDAGGPDRGAVYILFMNASGTVSSTQKITDVANFPGSPLDDGDTFGGAVANLGDLDGAGASVLALAVGTQLDDDGGTDRGAVYVLFLNASGTVLSVQKLSDLVGNFTDTFADGDEFGTALANLGDIDGAAGGVTALAVGVAANDDGGFNRGAVQILFLNSNGTCNSSRKISGLTGGFTGTLDDEDGFGSSLGFLGDVDGAGSSTATLASGTTGDDDGGADRGAVHVLFLDGIPITRTLTVNVVGQGTVTKSPNQASYPDGSSVQLTANPSAGWSFSAWSGSLTGSTNPASLTMNADKTVTATFLDTASPTVSVTSPNGGEALIAGVSSNITWTAADNAGVTTVDLELSRTGSAGPFESIATGIANSGTFSWLVTLPATSQARIRVRARDAAGNTTTDLSNADFSIAGRSLTVNTVGVGTVAKVPNQATYANGTVVQLTASPGAGWSFSAWSGSLTGSTNPANLTMNADKTVTATFLDTASPTVSVTSPNGGEALIAGVSSNITWTAADNAAVTTVDLELSRTGSAGPFESIATGIANSGTFSWLVTLPATSQARIRVRARDAAGNTTTDLSNADFSIAGRSLTVNTVESGRSPRFRTRRRTRTAPSSSSTASPGAGWSFSAWSGSLTGSTNPANLTMNADKTVTATFLDTASPTVSVTSPNGGEALVAGVSSNITWTAADNAAVTTVDLELSRTGSGGPYTSIATGLTNSGTFSWPVSLPATTHAVIRATAHDAAGHTTQDVSNAEFTIAGRTLTVNTVGVGTVAKLPDQATYANGTVVQLTASPGSGWSFSAWSGSLTGSTNPANLTMNADKTVTATFLDTASPTVSVTSPNGGEALIAGVSSNITWTAADNAGVTTVDLELSRTGSAGPFESIATGIANSGTFSWLVTLPATSQARIRVRARDAAGNTTTDLSNADFSIAGRSLTVNTVGVGTVAKVPNQATYANGTVVQLTANPGAGWSFSAWSGSLTGSTNPASLTMDADKTVTATFVDTAAPTATVTAPNGAEQLTSGTHVNITWTAADNVGVTSVDLELSRAGAAGPFESIATGIANSGTFDWLVTLPATSQALIRVRAHDAAGNTTTDLSNADFSIAAPVMRTLTVNVVGQGTVTKSPDQASYLDGSSVQLTANPSADWAFSAWSGSLTGSTNPSDLTMDADKTVTATFVDVAAPTATVTAPNGAEQLTSGTHVNITWTAADNVGVTSVDLELSRAGAAGPFESITTGIANSGTFDWLVTLPATSQALIRVRAHDAAGNTTTDLSNADFSIAAPVMRTLTVNVVGQGTVAKSPDQASYLDGSSVQLTANPSADWAFSAWSGSLTGSTNPSNLTMDADKTVTATFVDVAAPTATVTAPNGAEQLISGTHVNITWTAADNVGVTSVDLELSRAGAAGPFESITTGIANSGTFDWLVTLPATSQALIRVRAHDAAGNTTTDLSNADFSIAAPVMRTLTVNVVGKSAVAKSPDQASYLDSSSVQLTANPSAGWAFSAWSGSLTGSTNPSSLTMDANKTVTATFVDVAAPTATLTTPNGGENLGIGLHFMIKWTAADNDTVNYVELALSRAGAAGPWETLAAGISNRGFFDWTVTLPGTTHAMIRVIAHDPAGHATPDVSDAEFTIAAGVGVDDSPITAFALSPLRPNPVRGGARFDLALPREAHVHLGVYDLQGRERLVLADDLFPAGRHAVDGARIAAARLDPGLYFLRMSVPGASLVQRFVLMK